MDDSSTTTKNSTPPPNGKCERWDIPLTQKAILTISMDLVGLEFSDARDRFIAKIAELKHKVLHYDRGYELRDLSASIFELIILSRALGFRGRPITLSHFVVENNIVFHVFAIHPTDCGVVNSYVMAAQTPFRELPILSVALTDANRRSIACRLESWALAAKSQQTRHWRTIKVLPADIDDGINAAIIDIIRSTTSVVIDPPGKKVGQSQESPQDVGDALLKDPPLKKIRKKEVTPANKHDIDDVILVAAYCICGSYRKAAAYLTEKLCRKVTKDQVYRAVHRQGGLEAVGAVSDSASVSRCVASHPRDRAKKFSQYRN